jgi:nitrate reductase gamma subunit
MSTREVFWLIPLNLQLYFYLAASTSVLIFFLGVWTRVSVWTSGVEDREFKGFGILDFFIYALKGFFSKNCILAKKSFQLATYRGLMLLLLIWGFSTLFLGTALLAIHHNAVPFLQGDFYYFYSFAMDIAGLLLMAGLIIAIARRHFIAEVRRVTSWEDLFLLYLLLLIVVSGFLLEGMRLTALRPVYLDFADGGAIFANIVKISGMYRVVNYKWVWIFHSGLVLILIAYLPFSKFFHLFSAQVSVAAAEKRYGGAIGGR